MNGTTDIKKTFSTDKSWYKKIWTLDIKNMGWVEETKKQVDFIWNALGLKGRERILDLACGFGRHSLELARRGCEVVGVDITKEYVEDADENARSGGLSAVFIPGDVRDIAFDREFDAVLNMADGAIGYLENDDENMKIFMRAAAALKRGGKQLIDICNADYARRHFPRRHWLAGRNALSLADFEWDDARSIMYYGGLEIEYGKTMEKPVEMICNPTRLYGKTELMKLYAEIGMEYLGYYGNFDLSTPGSDDILQVQVVAEKK